MADDYDDLMSFTEYRGGGYFIRPDASMEKPSPLVHAPEMRQRLLAALAAEREAHARCREELAKEKDLAITATRLHIHGYLVEALVKEGGLDKLRERSARLAAAEAKLAAVRGLGERWAASKHVPDGCGDEVCQESSRARAEMRQECGAAVLDALEGPAPAPEPASAVVTSASGRSLDVTFTVKPVNLAEIEPKVLAEMIAKALREAVADETSAPPAVGSKETP